MDHASRYRYSVASTSTLFIPEEEDEDEENSIPNSKQQRRSLHVSSSSYNNGDNIGRGVSKGKLRRQHPSQSSEYSQYPPIYDEMIENDPLADEQEEETAQGPDELDDLEVPEERGNTAEDPLDTLIRISSELLRTSKAILASSKRVNIVNGAIAQTAYTQEHELRRHLESLEQGDRFMSLMSRDAHYILHPTSEEPPLPSSSYARPPQVRLRSRLSDGAAHPSRARTMYIHANIGSSGAGDAMSPLPHTPLSGEPTQQMEEEVVQEISGLFTQKQAMPAQASPKPNISSPTLSSTSSSSPSTFLSSLFSRRSYASTTSSADSLPAKEVVEPAKKADAKSLLSALAGNQTGAGRPSRVSPERLSSTQLQKQQSTASFASAAVSDSYTAQLLDRSPSPSPSPSSPSPHPPTDMRPSHSRKMSSAALSNAQLSTIMADNAHMTLSSRSSRGSSKGHTRSSFSLSENLLRASTGGSYSATSPLQQKLEENERAVGKRRSANRIAQAPKLQISNVPIMAKREGRSRELSAPI